MGKFDEISVEPDRSAHRFILTGRPTAGKTYLLSTVPGVFILHIENGLKGASPNHRPAHFKSAPRTLREFLEACDAFLERNADKEFKHFGIDGMTGLEELVHLAAMKVDGADHMGAKDFNTTWEAAAALWIRVREKLNEVWSTGVHVWILAHSAETVETTGSGEIFRKWDLFFRGPARFCSESRTFWRGWADHVFFIEWASTLTTKTRGKRQMGKYDGRVLITREDAQHFAKTRSQIPGQLPASWQNLSNALAAGAANNQLKKRAADMAASMSKEDAEALTKAADEDPDLAASMISDETARQAIESDGEEEKTEKKEGEDK